MVESGRGEISRARGPIPRQACDRYIPIGHPLRDALHLDGDQLREVTTRDGLKQQKEKPSASPCKEFQEDGFGLGALLTLRDLG